MPGCEMRWGGSCVGLGRFARRGRFWMSDDGMRQGAAWKQSPPRVGCRVRREALLTFVSFPFLLLPIPSLPVSSLDRVEAV